MYGQTISSDGKDLTATSSLPIITGLHVKGNEIVSLTLGTDQSGNPVTSRAELKIKQENGAILRHTIWDGMDAAGVDRLNGFILHLCTAFVTPSEYKALLGTPSNFVEFIQNVNNNILPKAQGKKFTMTVIRKENKDGRWYAQLPQYPNFIELDGTNPSTLYMKKSYIFEAPETTDMSKENDLAPSTAPVASSTPVNPGVPTDF